MSYEHNQNPSDFDPWDQGEYRTGATKPPKKHTGLIAVLLVAVILLCGVVSILGVMNIRLFQQLNSIPEKNDLPTMNHNHTEPNFSNFPSSTTDDRSGTAETIAMSSSPVSSENLPQKEGLSLQSIYDKNIPSVVSISCTLHGGSSTGTGVILSDSGYIVTNSHVVDNAQSITVLLSDSRTLPAILIGADSVSDLAVLHVTAEDLIPAELGDSSVLRVGDTVVAIGDPLGIELRGTMTDGIVSAINRDIDISGRSMNLIQTNAALNSGNSGGPLINCFGQVIGINTMKMGDSMSSGGVEGLGFAIPSTTVRDIVNQLIEKGYVSGRPYLGISGDSISEFYQFYYRLPKGLYITEVDPESSAATAGIEPGDILISIDKIIITSSHALETVLYSYIPGDTVQAVIYRAGKQYSVTLTVGEATG